MPCGDDADTSVIPGGSGSEMLASLAGSGAGVVDGERVGDVLGADLKYGIGRVSLAELEIGGQNGLSTVVWALD